MKFSDYPYQRPDMASYEKEFNALLAGFEKAPGVNAQNELLTEINRLRSELESMRVITKIRHTVDTGDSFYAGEQDFFDQALPLYKGMVHNYYKAILSSPYRAELEQKWGSQLFILAELSLVTFRPEIIPDLQEENKLSSDYTKLIASARINFAGEERNLQQLIPFQQSEDREVRKQAHEARYSFFSHNSTQFDELYHKLVGVRHKIARKLGFRDFTELAYARLNRTAYNASDVAGFREQIYRHIVPAANRQREAQRRRLGLEALKYYDDNLFFPEGNPKPLHGGDWMVGQAAKMYNEMSPETAQFFSFMQQGGLMDLETRRGKAAGGYCTLISKYSSPFIFANFNGTAGDLDVLTHEAGHALQFYFSSKYKVPEYHLATYEICEIHSMAMEFWAWPWLDLFFGGKADQYKHYHLMHSLLHLPYEAVVDEFQHLVYSNPDASPQEIKAMWRQTEKKYLPHLDYKENAFLEEGGYWQQQGHLFNVPFYYIDYALAMICALQYLHRARVEKESAWQDYLELCCAGGSRPFDELISLGGLQSPFAPGCVQSQAQATEAMLEAWE